MIKKSEFLSGFHFATAKVASTTAMTRFFQIISNIVGPTMLGVVASVCMYVAESLTGFKL